VTNLSKSEQTGNTQILTVGSLFAGIGGFDLGFERAGFKTLWQVEIDPYCRRVLERHFPHAERFADVRECGRHNLKSVDVITGGFPCQDISNAGKRAGIEGERFGLWTEMRRVICEVRPQFVVVENVAALLGRGIERVLGDLAESGYDAEWDCIPASAFGAPHQRDRVWILAYAEHDRIGRRQQQQKGGKSSGNVADADAIREQQSQRNKQQKRRRSSDRGQMADAARTKTRSRSSEINQGAGANATIGSRERGSSVPDTSESRLSLSEQKAIQRSRGREKGRAIAECDWWTVEPNMGRVAHGVPARVDRLKGLGNALVPQIAEWIARRIVEVAAA